MTCLWCSTPQSQKTALEILHIELNCQKCGRCAEACPIKAIAFSEAAGPKIDRATCDGCGRCVEACLHQAMELVGESMTVEQLFREVNKDSPFFRRSKGGVTMGGGEPTMQPEFVTAFLTRCKQQYIHTAIETCAHVKWRHLEKLLEYLDLVYVDIKHMDPVAHRELTGVSNELILENVRRAANLRPMTIRIPLVPGCNDSDDNILDTAAFAAGLGENLQRVELLPYHQFGVQTYGRIGMEYQLNDVEPPSDDHMQRLKAIVESRGVEAQIGG